MILNAFLAVLLVAVLGIAVNGDAVHEPLVWAVFAAIAGLAMWINYFATKNPRFLTYGPREYLRESEMNHALNLIKMNAASKADKPDATQ